MTEPKTDLRIHIDELEYTRDGLKTRDAIPLQVGRHNRVVIVRATKARVVPFGRAGFGFASSFPNPALLPLLFVPSLQQLYARLGSPPTYQVFGHAERHGKDDENKVLSDRRAQAFVALMHGDVDAFEDIAHDSGWGDIEAQLMLRALGCDPGPIDGIVEDLAITATRNFQIDYNGNVFHRHTPLHPREQPLGIDGKLGGATLRALRESYVLAYSPRVPKEQFVPDRAAVGCSEFNLLVESGAANRRVGLVVHDALPLHHERAPCTEGDAGACPVRGNEMTRCLWYAEHIIDPPEPQHHHHYDLRWLRLDNGNVLLSALTSLPDDEGCAFQVYRTKPMQGPDDVVEANLDGPLSDDLSGIVRSGVAQVVWAPPEGFFDDPGYVIEQRKVAWRPPVFRIVAGGSTALSQPWQFELDRAELAEDADRAVVLDAFGRLQLHVVEGRRVVEERPISEPGLDRGRGMLAFRPKEK